MAATGTRHNLHHTVLTGFPVIAFALLSWIILLAGVSALQSSCNSEGYASVGTVLPALSCGKAYKYQWWKTLLQLFVVLAVAAGLGAGWLRMHRPILLTLLAIITVMLMDDVDTFVTLNSSNSLGFQSRIRTYLAGAIMSCITNFLLIFALGSEHDMYNSGRNVDPAAVHSGRGLPAASHDTTAAKPMTNANMAPHATAAPTMPAPAGDTVV